MSEVSLNVVPAPELVTAAAPAPLRPGAGNPFAALLAGVLGGTQTLAPPAAANGTEALFPDLASDAAEADATGSLPPLPALAPSPVALPAALPAALPSGNALPAGGNGLPLSGGELPAPATGTPAPPPPPERISLAALALTRPVAAPPVPVPAIPGDEPAVAGGATGPVANPLPLVRSAGTDHPDEVPAAARLPASTGAPTPTPATVPLPLPQANDRLTLRLAGADLTRSPLPAVPLAGGEWLAGHIAAFAAAADTSPATTLATTTLPASATDGGTLAGRLAGTGLPPLQPLGDGAAFAGGLADRLLTLAGPGSHSARLRLHPEQLGELDVQITLEDGTAQVWFGTSSAQAREAIEGTLPRLKEMFAEQGIQLTRTQVDTGTGNPGQSASGQSASGQERRTSEVPGPWAAATRRDSRIAGDGSPARPAPDRLLDVWA